MILEVVLILLVFLSLLPYINYTYRRRWSEDDLHALPFLGNVANVALQKESIGVNLKHFYHCYRKRGEKFAYYYVFFKPLFVPIDLELIKTILIKDFDYFTDHVGCVNEKTDPLSANLFNLKGEQWKSVRPKLSAGLTTSNLRVACGKVVEYAEVFREILDKMIEAGEIVTIREVSEKYTADIIASCGFGLESQLLTDQDSVFKMCLKKMFHMSFVQSVALLTVILFPKILKVIGVKQYDETLTNFFVDMAKTIVNNNEKEKNNPKVLIERLIQPKSCEEEPLSLEQLAGQCFGYFLAGVETAASVITYTLFELASHHDIQDKARTEVCSTLERNGGKITYDSIMEMAYLDKCVLEALRLYPPAPLTTRTCTKSYKVPNSDVIIKEGTDVLIPILGLHTDGEFFPGPEKYNPERYPEQNSFAFMPFGSGPRKCIGYKFGILNVKILLVTLLTRFRFFVHSDTGTPLKFTPTTFLLEPEKPIKLIAERLYRV